MSKVFHAWYIIVIHYHVFFCSVFFCIEKSLHTVNGWTSVNFTYAQRAHTKKTTSAHFSLGTSQSSRSHSSKHFIRSYKSNKSYKSETSYHSNFFQCVSIFLRTDQICSVKYAENMPNEVQISNNQQSIMLVS